MADTRFFDFGINWQAFSERKLNENIVSIACESLQSLMELDKLDGMSFLDIGCGSGLFSIAAHKLGAEKIVGIDISKASISCSIENRLILAADSSIRFLEASVLDQDHLNQLGKFDIVYAWGSLHHTGSLWISIENAGGQVSQEGLLVISIYNQHFTSPVWKRIKEIYNQIPEFLKKAQVVLFGGVIYIAKFVITQRNPLKKERGMDFWYDVIDWVGGYPYEYANSQDVIEFVEDLGFRLQKFVHAQVPTGCNEFVFKRLS